jgi:LmbE family N-acetylglucosaminyl deacetylase
LLVDGYQPWKVRQVWLSGAAEPNVYIDISETMALKKEALLKHPSQLGEDVLQFAEQWAADTGKAIGLAYAENFRRFILEEDPISE